MIGWRAIAPSIPQSYSHQFQGAYDVVSNRVSNLKDKIRKDVVTIINSCKTEDELDFLFPEITRIHNHDLAVLDSWQNHVDWIQTLSPKERQLLVSSDVPTTKSPDNDSAPAVAAEPEEQLLQGATSAPKPR